MIWRILLLPAIGAAAVGLFLAAQIDSRTVDLGVASVSGVEEAAYLGYARTGAPELWAASDDQLVRIGLALCTALEEVDEGTVTPAPMGGLTVRELRAVTDAATSHLCPGERGKVAGYLRDAR